MIGSSSGSRRAFLGAAASAAVAATVGTSAARLSAAGASGAAGTSFRPEDFGAAGDGQADDTAAFQALGAAVSARGGGTIVLKRGATYRVGRQDPPGAGQRAYGEQPMLLVKNVAGLVIQGNGATLKLNDGLRYGSFDPATGQPFAPPAQGGFKQRSYAAVVGQLLEVADSRDIHITGLVLDGNMDRLIVGGRWGDVEIQLAAMGLQLTRVSEAVIEDVTCRNNGLDGVYLYGRNTAEAGAPSDNIVLRRVHCDRNGRQGMSVVGGSGLRFEQCVFANTAQGPIASRPMAGVDIEPNGANWATGVVFANCLFVNNRGVGLLAGSGNSRDITAQGCTFWQGFNPLPGVTVGSGDAFWITKDGAVIDGCQVHGSVSKLAATGEVRRSNFDNAVHPRFGRSAQRRGYLLNQAGGVFTRCTFAVDGDAGVGLIFCKQPIAFRSCQFRFGATARPLSRAVAVLSPDTVLQDVTFTEAPGLSKDRRFIEGGVRARLLGKVVVTGPSVRWNSRNGPIGDVTAQGRSPP